MKPDLHAQIMNLQPRRDPDGMSIGWSPAYLDGFRDARHAADEIALQADAVRDELLAACKEARVWLLGWATAEPYISKLDEAIAKATGAPV